MGFYVIGVAIATNLIVRNQNMRLNLINYSYQKLCSGIEIGLPKNIGAIISLCLHHSTISKTTEEAVVSYSECTHGISEFDFAVCAESIISGASKVREFRNKDFTLFAPSAGNKCDLSTSRGIQRHCCAIVDRFIIGMGMHQENAITRI